MDARIDTVEFKCAGCGRAVRARIDQGGRSYPCPGCGAVLQIPKVAMTPRTTATPPAPTPSAPPGTNVHIHGHTIQQPGTRYLKTPSSVGELLRYMVCVWFGFSMVLLILSLFSTVTRYLSGLLFIVLSAGSIYQIYSLMRARQQ